MDTFTEMQMNKYSCNYSIMKPVETGKGKGKGHPCTGTEALYRPYGP